MSIGRRITHTPSVKGKKELASSVVGTGEGWLTELSNAELRDLFALRADAVGE